MPTTNNNRQNVGTANDRRSDGEPMIVATKALNNKESEDQGDEATYLGLLSRNRPFRLYMLSYVITHTGEYLTYVSSIALTEELLKLSGTTSRTTISSLVVVRLLPNVLLSPFGGLLADGRDRRTSMIILDLLGAISPLLFLLALHFQSIPVIFIVTFIQQCIAGLYEPCRSAIISLLVPEENHLKKATTLAGLAWSIFTAVGSSLGGFVLTWLGFKACFYLDSITYLFSAYLMYLVGGTWNVADSGVQQADKSLRSLWAQLKGMTCDVFDYLRGSFFGPLVLLKASGGIIYGGGDVLSVTFSEPNGMNDKNSPLLLGILFASVGVGCTIGPLIADAWTNMKQPRSLQRVCILSLAISGLGFFGVALFDPFWSICLFTLLRTAGASVNWIDSSLLLQKFTSDEMMGRVLSIDFCFALLTESFSAYLAGYLQDQIGFSAQEVALLMAWIGVGVALVWLVYDLAGKGAAAAPQKRTATKRDQDFEKSERTPLILPGPVV